MKRKKIGKKIKRLVIDCRKWARGGFTVEFGQSRLLNSMGNMCCLGFECVARGLKKSSISNQACPSKLSCVQIMNLDITGMTKCLKETPLICEAIEINDSRDIDDKERMSQLKKLFKRRKISLKFINVPKGS